MIVSPLPTHKSYWSSWQLSSNHGEWYSQGIIISLPARVRIHTSERKMIIRKFSKRRFFWMLQSNVIFHTVNHEATNRITCNMFLWLRTGWWCNSKQWNQSKNILRNHLSSVVVLFSTKPEYFVLNIRHKSVKTSFWF